MTKSTTDSTEALQEDIKNIVNSAGSHWDAIVKVAAYTESKIARAELEGRISELESLDTHRHYGKDYQESLDELDDYKDNRITAIKSQLESMGK